MAQQIADVFYSTILPPLLVFLFGYWMWLLQRKGGSTTVDEFQKLFDEVQEERDNLKASLAAIESYKADCDKKIESYRNQVSAVMDSEMEKRINLEKRLETVEHERDTFSAENRSLRALVNALTEKLATAQAQLQSAQAKIEEFERILEKVNREIRDVKKKQTGELHFSEKDKDTDESTG